MVFCSRLSQSIESAPKMHRFACVCILLSHTVVAPEIMQLFIEHTTSVTWPVRN